MARATISIQTLSHGLAPTYTSVVAADDAQYLYNPKAFLHVTNTTGSGIILTIATNGTVDGSLTVPARTITVPANSSVFTRVLADTVYKQSDGYVYLNAPANGLDIAVLEWA